MNMSVGTLYVEELKATKRGRFAWFGAGIVLLTVGCVATSTGWCITLIGSRCAANRCANSEAKNQHEWTGEGQNRECCRSTKLVIVVPRRSRREVFLWKVKNDRQARKAVEKSGRKRPWKA
jgi:hypothetical protein